MKYLMPIVVFAACSTDVEPCDVTVDPSCAVEGEDCGELPAEGLCDGDVLHTCVDETIETTDCGADSLVCGALPDESTNECASSCAVAGIDDIGMCSSETEIERCVDSEPTVITCAEGTQCVAAADGPLCQSSEQACSGVGPQGRCDGNSLTTCASGWPQTTDCGASAKVCGYTTDELGYQCIGGEEAGNSRIAGRAFYEDRPISPGAIGEIRELPVRGANVYLLADADDSVLAHAVTANDGSYTLRTSAALGIAARVTVTSSSQVPVRPVRVTRSSGNSHAFGSPSFDLTEDQARDILVTEDSQAAPAFNILDNLILGLDYTRSLGSSPVSALTARWQRGASGGSYYQGGTNFLNIAGGTDDDGYDDIVILHEFGHYHQDEYGGTSNPGGPHPSAGGDDPRLAWAEGQATYIAMLLTGVPYFIDTNFADGGWFVELEDNVHAANPNGSMNQRLLEWMVAELLWDVGDHADQDGDDDPAFFDHEDAMRVTTEYFRDSAYVGRGVGGFDLVDWLDGWFWLKGASGCAAMKTLVRDVFGFPYDFAACE